MTREEWKKFHRQSRILYWSAKRGRDPTLRQHYWMNGKRIKTSNLPAGSYCMRVLDARETLSHDVWLIDVEILTDDT